MTEKVVIELAVGFGGILTGIWALIKYVIRANMRRESQMLEYFEKKNGHIERITNRFMDTAHELSESINELTTEIKLLAAMNTRKK